MAARRVVRYGLLGLAGLIVLVVAIGTVALARFDPNSLKPRITTAVEHATGRTLALSGPIHLVWSLWPTVALSDVSLSNPPGFSRPQMATLQRLDVQLAVLPLLHDRVAITRLVLQHPDILLETDAQGRPNWTFAAQPAPAGSSSPMAKPGAHRSSPEQVSVTGVSIQDGSVAWRDDRTGQTLTLAVQHLTATAASPEAALHLAVAAAYNGLPFTLDGDVGSLLRLQQPAAATPWPVRLTLAAAGATASVSGNFSQPQQGRGYSLAVTGTIPDLSALAPLLPGARLPPLRGVQLTAQVADSGGPVPRVESATLKLGPADLSGYVGGLRLVAVDIDAPAQNQPVQISAQATMDETPLSLTATLGAPGTLMAQRPGAPVPVDVTLRAADANLAVKGTLAHPESLSGVNFALNASIPDLAALSPVLRRPLPALTQVAFRAQLTDAQGGLEHGAALHGIALTAAQGDLSGDLAFQNGPPLSQNGPPAPQSGTPAAQNRPPAPQSGTPAAQNRPPAPQSGTPAAQNRPSAPQNGPPPSVTGTLHANRIDADAMLAAAGKPVTARPPPTAPAAASPSASPPPPPATTPPPPRPPTAGRLFSDTPLPFGLLRLANADIAATIGDLRSGGVDYRSISLHVVLQGGRLRIDPLDADLPEGKLGGSLAVDATSASPSVALTLHAPGLEVAPLFAAAGLPGYASGRLEVYADLQSAGASPHAIAAGLDGTLGLAMPSGTIDTALLNKLLGPVLQRANLLGLVAHGGSGELRCFALRADAHHGVADVHTLLLNSSVLTMDGGGSVNLGEETLAMALRPQGRVAGTGLVVPLQVTGPIREPDVKVNAVGTFEANAGTVAGGVIGGATPLGLLGGLVGGGKLLGGGAAVPSCAEALAVARGGPMPAASAAHAEAAPAPKKGGVGGVLRQLFH